MTIENTNLDTVKPDQQKEVAENARDYIREHKEIMVPAAFVTANVKESLQKGNFIFLNENNQDTLYYIDKDTNIIKVEMRLSKIASVRGNANLLVDELPNYGFHQVTLRAFGPALDNIAEYKKVSEQVKKEVASRDFDL